MKQKKPTFITAAGAIRFLLKAECTIEILLNVLNALTEFIHRPSKIRKAPQWDFPAKPGHLQSWITRSSKPDQILRSINLAS